MHSAHMDPVEHLLERLAENGITKGEAARRCAIPDSVLSRIIHRRRLPTLTQAVALEREFGVPPREWVQ